MAADVFELEILGDSEGEPCANILAFETISGTGDLMDDLAGLITAFRGAPETKYLDCMPSKYTLLGYKSRRVNNGGSPTMAVPVTGMQGTDPAADDTADAASGGTILAYYNSDPTPKFPLGHVVAGKIFMPAPAISQIVNSALSADYITRLQDFIVAVTAAITGGGGTWKYVVWSKTFSKSFGPFDVTVSGKVGIQKRRLLPTF